MPKKDPISTVDSDEEVLEHVDPSMSQLDDYGREFDNMDTDMFSSITPQGTKRARSHSPGSSDHADESMVDKLSTLLDSKLGKIEDKLSKLDEIQTSLKNMSDKINAVEDSQRAAVDRQVALESAVQSLQEENASLRDRISSLESNSKINNLLFHNVGEKKNEDVPSLIRSISNDGGVKLDKRAIVKAHRVGGFNNGRTRSIVAQFHHHQDRTDVLKAASSIKKSHSNIIITEDFPAAVQKNRRVLLPVFHAAKDRFKGQDTNVSLRGDILTIGNTKYGIKDISKLPANLSPHNACTAQNEDTVAFFSMNSKFSNHHPCNFVCNGDNYNCVEQYLMHQKALLFKNDPTALKVMTMNNPTAMKQACKQLLKDDNDRKKWQAEGQSILLKGLYCKFSQNDELRQVLLATGTKTIIEASDDQFWGIGIRLRSPDLFNKSKWSGKNVTGSALMKVREKLATK